MISICFVLFIPDSHLDWLNHKPWYQCICFRCLFKKELLCQSFECLPFLSRSNRKSPVVAMRCMLSLVDSFWKVAVVMTIQYDGCMMIIIFTYMQDTHRDIYHHSNTANNIQCSKQYPIQRTISNTAMNIQYSDQYPIQGTISNHRLTVGGSHATECIQPNTNNKMTGPE